ncbi:hypothetical protein LTR62_005503 [Meristemomyces frigidus]|uniref:Condensin complex subunit 2 n=1 Tax=Meristemomyces frigidus TaxID=1508187 RepID=A0AAN7YF69_9PEZI|nr:hypothetical protein LTR62_005503 [Meristemomyces frigidus]
MPRQRAPASYVESPVKARNVPLNDDDEEKAQRFKERRQLQSTQKDRLKAAAASPAIRRQRKSLAGGGEGGDGPLTPSQGAAMDEYGVAGNAVTPMKRVPLLANFEEWMKMATDNKINANNSWNFALIDYFHDMTLLREGDGVNFQKASCTLDGCVKIYTSRVDSVATETGRLLSGLADGGRKKGRGGGEEDGEGEGEGEGEEGEEDGEGKKKARKKVNRSAEATLVNTFEQLKLKKMELEFSVDPLFKKAAADFDEGGAKGLLMNHLSIDSTGRIVFDSSDDVQETGEETRRDSMEPEGEGEKEEEVPADSPIDIARLGTRFFPNLNRLDEQDVCPSLKTFELGAGDGTLDLPFLKAPENWRDDHPEPTLNNDGAMQDDAPGYMDDDDDIDVGGAGGSFDLQPETGFGEGGEAWARDAALHPQMRVHDALAHGEAGDDQAGEVGVFDTNSASYGVTLQHRANSSADQEQNILNYFDTALHSKNWAGPEHWKIARIKQTAAAAAAPARVRKEKEPFEIDFAAPMGAELAAMLYTKATNASQITLPKAQWRTRGRNLLPDDKHFHSEDLLTLFLKPKAKIGSRRAGRNAEDGEVAAAYWASTQHDGEEGRLTAQRHPMDDDDDEAGVRGDYDANFFADDALPLPGLAADIGEDEDLEFADAREEFSPTPDEVGDAAGGAADGPEGRGIDDVIAANSKRQTDAGAFGAQLVTQSRRLRPEYVQYARTAKKVDVRRLKENMWLGIGMDEPSTDIPATPSSRLPPLPKDTSGSLNFTAIMNNLQHAYPPRQMQDISTSYGFICLLHLANEKGLVVENVEGWGDLVVRRDEGAVDLDNHS